MIYQRLLVHLKIVWNDEVKSPFDELLTAYHDSPKVVSTVNYTNYCKPNDKPKSGDGLSLGLPRTGNLTSWLLAKMIQHD